MGDLTEAQVRALRIRDLKHRIAKKKDGLLACYQVIAEHAPKLAKLEAEFALLMGVIHD